MFRRRIRQERTVRRTNVVLGFLDRFESVDSQKCEDRRSQTDDALAWNQYGPAQDAGIDLVQNVVILRDATGIDHALDVYSMLSHAIENHSGMKCGPFDGGKKFVLR